MDRHDLKYLIDKLRVWMQGDGYHSVESFPVQGYSPDLIGLSTEGRYANGEAKTPDRFDTERTRNKLTAFATAKDKDGTWIPLYIAVPKGHEAAMQKLIDGLAKDTSHVKIKGF